MQGKRVLQWIWDWLGQGSMGEPYQVIPSVQPVVIVDGLEYPIRYERYGAVANLAAGTISVYLADLPTGKSRLWINITLQRSNPASGDSDALYLQVGTGRQQLALAAGPGSLLGSIPVPLIGGWAMVQSPGGTINTFQGGRPVLQTPNNQIFFEATAAAAVGTWTMSGLYIDIPVNAPIPPNFLG